MRFHGIVPPLVTPFRDDERIDYTAWQRIIDMLLGAGVDGLFVCGSTGEFQSLDPEERAVALRFCRQAAGGRVPVYGNVGCATTRETVALALLAQSDKIDVVAVVTPYYARVSQDELYEHYCEVCRSVRLPVLAYNYPPHGGSQLLPETVGRIAAACDNFIGLKDASGDIEQMLAYRNSAPGRAMAVFVGPENLIASGLAAGCDGCVSSGSNFAPKLFVDLHRAIREGRAEEAARLQTLVDKVGAAIALHTFPSVTKAALEFVGIPAGPCRRPIGPLPAAAREDLSRFLAVLRAQGYLPVGTVRSASVRS